MILEKVYDELMAQIEDLKKAIAGGSGGSKDYDKLDNRPKVNNITLTGNKKSSDLKIAYSMTEAEYAAATKNAESIYCLQENATSFEEEDETASSHIEWSAGDPSGYVATWVYTPSNQNFTGCSAVECDDAAISIETFSVVENKVQVFISCEDTTQIGETVTFTFTLTQPAGGSRIVKNGIDFATELYSDTPVIVGKWVDGRPVYRVIVKDTISAQAQGKVIYTNTHVGLVVSIKAIIEGASWALTTPFKDKVDEAYFNFKLTDGTLRRVQSGGLVSDYPDAYVILDYVETI